MRDFSNRRRFLEAAFGASVLLFPVVGKSESLAGVKAIDTESIYVRCPTDVLLVSITRIGNRLIAVGEHGVIVYSDDSGVTWTQADVPVDVTLTCVAFATPMEGWVAGHFGVVLRTVDGGKTWQRQLDGLQANRLMTAAAQAAVAQKNPSPGTPHALKRAEIISQQGAANPFLTLFVFSSQKVIVFGAYRMVDLTNDGGISWADRSLEIYDPFSQDIYGVTAIGSDLYLACEAGLVFRSTDAGVTFLPVTPPSETTLLGILGTKDGSIIVYGVAGTCFRSTDGGSSWATISLSTQDDITTGRCLDSGRILLATETGTLYISKDNGVTAEIVPGIQPVSIFDIEMAPDGDLLVVGSSGIRQISKTFFNV
jgi:photosystem II stability/assembly factor-like uncharacterized protein